MAWYALMLFCCGLPGQAADVSPEPTPAMAVPSAFSLIETESRRIAYVEHTGAYWSLGSVIDSVARDAKSMGRRGRLYVRYLEHAAGSPGTVHAQIGFELPGSDNPKPPYDVAQWPPSLVASKKVLGSDGLSPRHFAAMKAWVRTEGLIPSGDLIAVVDLSENGQSTAIERAEIQLPVCAPDPPAETQATPLRAERAFPPDPQAGEAVVTSVIPLPVQVPAIPAGGVVQETPAARPVVPAAPVAVPTAPPAKAGASEPTSRDIPVRLWIKEEKFAELAAAILPGNADSVARKWADDVAGRVIALARGIKTAAPGQEGWLTPLADELVARREAIRSDGTKPARNVIGLSAASDRSAERKHVMRELDRLMVGLGYGSQTPLEVRERLAELLEVVPPLVDPQ
jgi:DNA gyrase inhibitor GyrI